MGQLKATKIPVLGTAFPSLRKKKKSQSKKLFSDDVLKELGRIARNEMWRK